MNLKKTLPIHVAIIMDGNGRWAIKRKLSRLAGHKKGAEAVRQVAKSAHELGIKILTLFAFSTENWKRDEEEVYGILEIMRIFLQDATIELNKNNVRLQIMGEPSKLPPDLVAGITNALEATKNNTGLTLNIAINYGARDEIARACNLLIASGKQSVTSQDIANNLYTAHLPDPDLVIRTSGEMRVSNFMLYQLAYSEFYFCKVFWPAFKKKHLVRAVKNFKKRDRRYGGNHLKLERK